MFYLYPMSFLTALLLSTVAQSGPPVTADVRLLAEHAVVSPGTDAWVGVHFAMRPGWHIYWQNPGDSGEPPRVEWTLPAGFSTGETQWPVPELIKVGPIVNYGYHGDVLLPVRLQVPPTAKVGDRVSIVARVSYIACADVCIPGKASQTLGLRIGKAEPSADAGRFARARQRLPVDTRARRGWAASATIGADTVTVSVSGPGVTDRATFFPNEPGIIDDSAPRQALTTTRGVDLRFTRSNQLRDTPREITGVLLLPDGQAFTIAAPVKEQAS
jgi:DsbC/DsbD-like thiol-disulfide interchange protein